MGGFFGTVKTTECVADLFYGTDYNSHVGTKRGGMVTYAEGMGFMRSIHSLESSYFRTKFEDELSKFKGNAGIGVISDTDPQPLLIRSNIGTFAICTIGIIITHIDQLPNAIAMVIDGAFNPTAAAGGFLGSSVMLAMRSGIARGIFSNESGLGSAPIVAAAAKTKWAPEQGLVSMTGTFIDTIIICTLTGLSLIVTGVWCGDLNGAAMTSKAFTTTYSDVGSILLMIGLSLFAFTTILGWNYYGERCVEYLMGVKAILPYRIIFVGLIACGPFLKLEAIWILADIVNGLMAIPNLIALLALTGVVVSETKAYMKHLEENKK